MKSINAEKKISVEDAHAAAVRNELVDESSDVSPEVVLSWLKDFGSNLDKSEFLIDYYQKYKFEYHTASNFGELVPFLEFIVLTVDHNTDLRTTFSRILPNIANSELADEFLNSGLVNEFINRFPFCGSPLILESFVYYSKELKFYCIQNGIIQKIVAFLENPTTYDDVIDVFALISTFIREHDEIYQNFMPIYNNILGFLFVRPEYFKHTLGALKYFMYDQNLAIQFLLNPHLAELLHVIDPEIAVLPLANIIEYTFDNSDKYYTVKMQDSETTMTVNKVPELIKALRGQKIFEFEYFHSLFSKYRDNQEMMSHIIYGISSLFAVTDFSIECENTGITLDLIQFLNSDVVFAVKIESFKCLLRIFAMAQIPQMVNMINMGFFDVLLTYFDEIKWSVFSDLMSMLYHAQRYMEIRENEEFAQMMEEIFDNEILDRLYEMTTDPDKFEDIEGYDPETHPFYDLQALLSRFDIEVA